MLTTLPNQVCKLQKPIYILKQAWHQWITKLDYFLISNNYNYSPADHFLFLKHDGYYITDLLIYIVNIALTGNNVKEIQCITNLLHCTFCIKNLGDLTYFLGFKVPRNHDIHLNQHKYVLYILHTTNMLNSSLVLTPMVPKQSSSAIATLLDNITYASL